MKTIALISLGVVLIVMSVFLLNAGQADNKSESVLRHVVLFKFKEQTTEQQLAEIVDSIKDLKNKIPEIQAFEWGTNVSQEGHSKGLTHCFMLTFKSQADLDVYLPHEDHKAFVTLAGPHIEDVTVVDYWTK